MNVLLNFLNINPKSLRQSAKFPPTSHWTREIKGCLVSPQVALGKRSEDVSSLQKPGIGKEQAREVLLQQKCQSLLYLRNLTNNII
jgi:hypothetical protein